MAFAPWLPLLLGVLTAVGPLSTDMYLPAFPAIERGFGLAEGSAQLTLATWFAGLSIGQLTQGTLADRYGRRRPLIAGTALYAIASAGCALSPDIVSLSAWRFLAALGGSASMVIPRAIVRDLAEGHAAARLLSQLMLVMGAAPILAPTLGGLVLSVSTWRTIFWIAAVYGAVCCVLVRQFLPDTLPQSRRVRLGLAAQLLRYIAILGDRGFITHVLMGGFAMSAMFAYIGGSPPVFIDGFHLTPPLYGALFGSCAFGLIAASQVNPRILPRFGSTRVLRTAIRVALAAAVVLVAVAISGRGGWLAIAIPIAVLVSCQGFVMPNATVGALARQGAQAGNASAMMGTIQFALGAVSGLVVGAFSNGSPLPMSLMMLCGMGGAVICDLYRPK